MAMSSTFTHSKHLFLEEDGSNMQFYMCPCAERAKLKPLVEHGGGSISNKRMKNSLMLTADLSRTYTEVQDYYSFKYILDCVKYNKLLRIAKYKLNQPANAESSSDEDVDISDDMSPSSVIIRTEARNCKGRKEYRQSDDMSMITYIMSECRYSEIRGNKLWSDMEVLGITKHTGQSMRARFLKVALPRITTYPVSRQWISILTNTKTERPALEFHGSSTVTSSTEKNSVQRDDEGSLRKRSLRKQPMIEESSSDSETSVITTETNNTLRNDGKSREKTSPKETRNRPISAPQNDWKIASEPSGSKHKMTLRKEGKNVDGDQQVMECTSTGSPHKMTLKKGDNIRVSDDERQPKHLPTRSTTTQKVTSKSVPPETANVHEKYTHKSNFITEEVQNERDTRNVIKDTCDVSSSQKEIIEAVVPINAVVVCRNSTGSSPSSRRDLRSANTRKQTAMGVAEKSISGNKKHGQNSESSGISTKKANAAPRVSRDSDGEDEYLIETTRKRTTINTISDNDKTFKKSPRNKSSRSPTEDRRVDTHNGGHNTIQNSPVKSSKQIIKRQINAVTQESFYTESDCSDDYYLFELAKKRKSCHIGSDKDDPRDKRSSHTGKFRKVNLNNVDRSSEDGSPVKSSSKYAKSPKKTSLLIQSKIYPQKSSKVANVEIPSNCKAVKDSGTKQAANVSRADPKNKLSSVKTSKPNQNVKVGGSKTAKRKMIASVEDDNTIFPENAAQSKKAPRPCGSRDDTSKSNYIEEWVNSSYSSEEDEELMTPSTFQQCLDDLADADDMLSQSVEPDSSSPEILIPVRNSPMCSTEEVDVVCDIAKELSAAFRLPISDITFALSANRGDVVSTIDWLTTGQVQNGKLDWRPEEDRSLLNSDDDAIEKLLERHDLESIEQRASFLENLNLTL